MAENPPKTAQPRPPRGETPPRTRPRTAASTRERSAGSAGSAGSSRSSGSGSAATPPTTPITGLRGEDKAIHDALKRFYGTVGMGLQMTGGMRQDQGLMLSGINIMDQADATADAWIEVAKQNPRVKQMLQGFIQGSAIANLVGCHLAMVVPFVASRGAIPGEFALMFMSDDAKQAAAAMAAAQAQQAAAQNGTPQ